MPDIGPFARISPMKTADEVVQQIELLLLDGVLRDGEKLPGERELAQMLDVSRPILRQALKELEARGLLVSHHGGGTYVADIIGEVFSQPLMDLIGRHSHAALDYLEYRRELEGLTAELAAKRATATDRALLQRIVADMKAAHERGNFDDELRADVELHSAIGEAAHNLILLHTLRACYKLLRSGIFFNRQSVFAFANYREKLLAQHVAICDAILAGRPEDAKAAAQAHIDFVISAVRESERAGEWDRVSRLRMLSRGAAHDTQDGKGRMTSDG